MFGHYRLSQDTDNQTKVYVVVSKRKEEVGLPVQVYGPFPLTVLFYFFAVLLAMKQLSSFSRRWQSTSGAGSAGGTQPPKQSAPSM